MKEIRIDIKVFSNGMHIARFVVGGFGLFEGWGETAEGCIVDFLDTCKVCRDSLKSVDIQMPEYVFKFYLNEELVKEVKV